MFWVTVPGLFPGYIAALKIFYVTFLQLGRIRPGGDRCATWGSAVCSGGQLRAPDCARDLLAWSAVSPYRQSVDAACRAASVSCDAAQDASRRSASSEGEPGSAA
ncbi:hypothetical protein EDD27_5327 [Nonomuraea polychroma]|uniref:Uncharacterized protein n=1 Tax=Nonomuraea polychroma TaxID=46176 RepID=A0A438MAE1_9ACTN|nr:hypothetical protein EDD27_5327 [Nonomuraea polychroma]